MRAEKFTENWSEIRKKGKSMYLLKFIPSALIGNVGGVLIFLTFLYITPFTMDPKLENYLPLILIPNVLSFIIYYLKWNTNEEKFGELMK